MELPVAENFEDFSGVTQNYGLQGHDAASLSYSRRFEKACCLPLQGFWTSNSSIKSSGSIQPLPQRRMQEEWNPVITFSATSP